MFKKIKIDKNTILILIFWSGSQFDFYFFQLAIDLVTLVNSLMKMFTQLTDCTIGTLNTYVKNKIIFNRYLKMLYQPLNGKVKLFSQF